MTEEQRATIKLVARLFNVWQWAYGCELVAAWIDAHTPVHVTPEQVAAVLYDGWLV